jgi:tRNA dimethylallyltransferase
LGVRDAPRIVRALAVWRATGVSIAGWREGTAPTLAPGSWLGVALTPPRRALYASIDARFDAMLAAGALEEVRALMTRGLDPGLPVMKAHGAPWLMAHLRGEMSLEAAGALATRDTRRYAKRQFTWIAHQAADWAQVADVAPGARVEQVCTLLNRLDGRDEVK